MISTITDRDFVAGNHRLMWDATMINPGVYIVRLQSQTGIYTRKLVVVK